VSRGRLIVISGPSGVGKTSVTRRLLDLRPDLAFSVSCTTRRPRPGEMDGKDYRFVTPATFTELVEDGAFMEWAEVFGNRYGTLAAPVLQELEDGRDVILDIDVQGAAAVRERLPEALLIFLVPPSRAALEARLGRRHTENEVERTRRLDRAEWEMAQSSWFDHVVVNDELERAARELAAIIDGGPTQPADAPDR
jgi:guanylate kinase